MSGTAGSGVNPGGSASAPMPDVTNPNVTNPSGADVTAPPTGSSNYPGGVALRTHQRLQEAAEVGPHPGSSSD
jgi:hypothetical protein